MIREKILSYCEENRIFGTVRVTVRDEVKLSMNIGYADIENKTEFSSDSAFSFYSLSKPFCALGLLSLYDSGIIDIDSHPSRYIPEAAGFDDSVNLRYLLHHTSGLPDFEQLTEFCENHKPGYACKARDHVKRLTAYPSYFKAGEGGRYANVNFVLCALVIENVTGIPYREYMKTRVFAPLSMKTAVIDDENTYIENRVKGYEIKDGVVTEVEKSHDWMFGAGDIIGTVDDVYCLNNAIKNKLLLTEKTWDTVLTPNDKNSMGMGCTVSDWHGKRRITHNGGHTGFRTLHIQLPEDDFDIIFLSNSGYGNARFDIAEMLHDYFYGKDFGKTVNIEMDKGYI